MPTDFRRIIDELLAHDVEFIVVGALSSVLQGPPISTFDIDIVHARDADNVDRLLEALDELNARYRGHGDRDLRPDAEALVADDHHLLETDAGPLDILGVIQGDLSYEDLIGDAVELDFDGESVQVLSLRRYVDFVEQSERPKDQGRLQVLRATLEQRDED